MNIRNYLEATIQHAYGITPSTRKDDFDGFLQKFEIILSQATQESISSAEAEIYISVKKAHSKARDVHSSKINLELQIPRRRKCRKVRFL